MSIITRTINGMRVMLKFGNDLRVSGNVYPFPGRPYAIKFQTSAELEMGESGPTHKAASPSLVANSVAHEGYQTTLFAIGVQVANQLVCHYAELLNQIRTDDEDFANAVRDAIRAGDGDQLIDLMMLTPTSFGESRRYPTTIKSVSERLDLIGLPRDATTLEDLIRMNRKDLDALSSLLCHHKAHLVEAPDEAQAHVVFKVLKDLGEGVPSE